MDKMGKMDKIDKMVGYLAGLVYLADLMYLAELRQLASAARTFEDYTSAMKRIERVCDRIERDLGLRVEEDTQLYRCLKCGSTWRSKEILDGSAHDACGGLVFRVRD